MKTLNETLAESLGKPTEYKGKVIQLYDHLELHKGDLLSVKILSTSSKNKQNIGVTSLNQKSNINLEVNGVLGNTFSLWEDTLPKEGTDIRVIGDAMVSVWNGWEEVSKDGGKRILQGTGNSGMIVEVNNNVRKYFANDGELDEDFDDIVFEITINKDK